MGVQVFDDGSTMVTDASGNVIGGTDNQGSPIRTYGEAGSGIVQQFSNLLTYGVRAAINARYGLANAQPQAAIVTQQAGTQQLVSIALFGGLAFALYKLIKG